MELPEGWEYIPLTKAIKKPKHDIKKLKKSVYKNSGKYPVVDQGQKKLRVIQMKKIIYIRASYQLSFLEIIHGFSNLLIFLLLLEQMASRSYRLIQICSNPNFYIIFF